MKHSPSIGGAPLILLLFALSGINPAGNGSAGGFEYGRSRQEIRMTWLRMKPTYSGFPYEVAPSVDRAFSPGTLRPGFIQDAVRVTNFIRYLAGLPMNVTSDDVLVETAQYGAVLLASSDGFAHALPRPSGMPEDFYQIGLYSTMTSNIARGFATIESTVTYGYIRDDDTYNLAAIGHRRWILNPSFRRTGFGFAEGLGAGGGRGIGNSSMQVHDQSGEFSDYRFVAWPAPGYFPREFFDSTDPWSISLNPALYQAPDADEVRVVLVRLSDGKRWVLDAGDREITSTREYFQVNLERYGIPNVIIFRPVPREVAAPGEPTVTGDPHIDDGPYRVEITGIRNRDGTPTSITYQVAFFDLESAAGGMQLISMDDGSLRK